MGFDVSGIKPTSEKGEYFRNNIWWWGGLWNFSRLVFEEMGEYATHCYDQEELEEMVGEGFQPNSPDNGLVNMGWGLNAEGARMLGERLQDAIAAGLAADAEQQLKDIKANQPLVDCDLCDASGIRTDKVGIEHGMHRKELDETTALVVGRSRGWCNGCGGTGRQEHLAVSYQFTVENVADFAEFCLASGGFNIW